MATTPQTAQDFADYNKFTKQNDPGICPIKPYVGFEKAWWKLFKLALGSKSDDGYTYRMVYEETDMGGANGPAYPGAAGANADQIRKHTSRVARLFDMLMNVLNTKSPIFIEL